MSEETAWRTEATPADVFGEKVKNIKVIMDSDRVTVSADNRLDYCNYEGMYMSGDGVGIQCDKLEYEVKELCNEITAKVRELRDLINE